MQRINAAYEATATLPDGQLLHLRAIRPDDREKLREGFFKLSKTSVRDRFFSIKRDLTPEDRSRPYVEVHSVDRAPPGAFTLTAGRLLQRRAQRAGVSWCRATFSDCRGSETRVDSPEPHS